MRNFTGYIFGNKSKPKPLSATFAKKRFSVDDDPGKFEPASGYGDRPEGFFPGEVLEINAGDLFKVIPPEPPAEQNPQHRQTVRPRFLSYNDESRRTHPARHISDVFTEKTLWAEVRSMPQYKSGRINQAEAEKRARRMLATMTPGYDPQQTWQGDRRPISLTARLPHHARAELANNLRKVPQP